MTTERPKRCFRMEPEALRIYLVVDGLSGTPFVRLQAATISRAAAIYRGQSVPRTARDLFVHNHKSCYSLSWMDDGARHHVFILEEVR